MSKNLSPATLRTRGTIALIALSTAGLLTGCETIRGWFGGGEKAQNADTPVVQPDAAAQPQYSAATQPSQNQTIPLPPQIQPVNRPVVQGPVPGTPPLVYLVETDGGIRVANTDTGEEIATFNAKAGQIISVTTRGIAIGGHPVIGATLAPGNYGIYRVLPSDAGGVQMTRSHNAPTPPKPATVPARPPGVLPGFEPAPPGSEVLTPTTQPGAITPSDAPPGSDLPPPPTTPPTTPAPGPQPSPR